MNYAEEATWRNYDPAKQADERITAISCIIPPDVATILDAGCGNGLITNALADQYQISGIDTSSEALTYLKVPALQASITDIPFADQTFDLVMSNEVLEHLGKSDFIKAISELKRVAQKYVIISVPFREQLEAYQVYCTSCGHQSHPYGHRQSFDTALLQTILEPEFASLRTTLFGPITQYYNPYLLRIRQQLFGQWFNPYEGWKCPNCSSIEPLCRRSIWTKMTNGLNRVLSKRHPYWIMVLYSKAR